MAEAEKLGKQVIDHLLAGDGCCVFGRLSPGWRRGLAGTGRALDRNADFYRTVDFVAGGK